MSHAVDLLNSHWVAEECPLYDGVIYGDGSRVPIDFTRHYLADGTDLEFKVGPRSRGDDWIESADCPWIGLTPSCELNIGTLGCAMCGGGAFGGDGFVALEDEQHYLVWVLFFEVSNPFTELEFRDGHLVVVNTHGETWRIPIDQPELLSATSP